MDKVENATYSVALLYFVLKVYQSLRLRVSSVSRFFYARNC